MASSTLAESWGGNNISKLENYLAWVNNWEYCYCQECEKIRYRFDLEVTENGIQCRFCGSYNLEVPSWVHCPHEKTSMVKCPRAGVGIRRGEYGYECMFHCDFRKP